MSIRSWILESTNEDGAFLPGALSDEQLQRHGLLAADLRISRDGFGVSMGGEPHPTHEMVRESFGLQVYWVSPLDRVLVKTGDSKCQ